MDLPHYEKGWEIQDCTNVKPLNQVCLCMHKAYITISNNLVIAERQYVIPRPLGRVSH